MLDYEDASVEPVSADNNRPDLKIETGNKDLDQIANANNMFQTSKWVITDSLINICKEYNSKDQLIETNGTPSNWKPYSRIEGSRIPKIQLDGDFASNRFGIKTKVYPNSIYGFYNEANIQLNRILEVIAGLTFDTMERFNEYNSKYPDVWDKYKKNITHYTEESRIKDSTWSELFEKAKYNEKQEKSNPISDFVDYCNSVFTKNKSEDLDIHFAMNTKEYLNVIDALKNELKRGSWEKLIKLDIENSINTMVEPNKTYYGNISGWKGNIKFRIQPYIIGFSKGLFNTQEQGTLPLFAYRVLVDINSVTRFILSMLRTVNWSYDRDERPVFTTRQEFINFINEKCPNFGDIIAKTMCISLFNNYNCVLTNWTSFISKFEDSNNKILTDPNILNMISKVKHLHSGSIDFTKIVDFFTDRYDALWRFESSEANKFADAIMNLDWGDTDSIRKKFLLTMFERSFTAFYEMTYSVEMDLPSREKNNIVFSRTKSETPDMFSDNSSDFNAIVNAIEDFNVKSFLTDCIKYKASTFSSTNKLVVEDIRARHMRWMSLTATSNICLDLLATLNSESNTDNDIYIEVKRKVTKVFLSLLEYICAFSGASGTIGFSLKSYFTYNATEHLPSILKYYNKFIHKNRYYSSNSYIDDINYRIRKERRQANKDIAPEDYPDDPFDIGSFNGPNAFDAFEIYQEFGWKLKDQLYYRQQFELFTNQDVKHIVKNNFVNAGFIDPIVDTDY